MNARPEIKEKLIELKLRHWCSVARSRLIAQGFPATQARKNFWRLGRKYPQIMQRLGLSETSVYK